MNVRRNSLKNIPFQSRFHPHAGLWFDKYLKKQKNDTDKMKPYVEHIRQTSEIGEPSAYRAFFKRWRDGLEQMGAQLREVEGVGRAAAGLGGASVIENGMTLHHTYGVPVIPGSSLKGTARAYAAANLDGVWADGGDAFRTLFGGQVIPPGKTEQERARVGIAVFYDALPLPGTFKVHNEVMTVHHKAYYRGDKNAAPADWDSPTPIPFPSVSGKFLIAVHAPDAPEWAASAMGILKMALAEMGVGGKTSSGYGRFISAPPSGYRRGKVERFGLGKHSSYGYIHWQNGSVFVHRNALRAGVGNLKAGDVVHFKVVKDQNGKKQAQDVHFP